LAILTNQENDYINELKSIAKNDNSEKRLHILPMVKQNEVSNYIRNVDYGVHAASDENENNIVALPNKLFEYLHAKIPIIVSDVETMKNFVETNNLGYVFNSGSVESCVEILNEAEKKKKKIKFR
jgi:glycosyltransferase involved in cell wall biosynthesis